MTTLIISSTQDPASTNIKKSLLRQTEWNEINTFFKNSVYQNKKIKNIYIVTINDKTIIHENIEDQVEKQLKIKPTQVIFISRHRSKSGKPTLTTHPIGNYGKADFGGKDKTLTPTLPRMMAELLRIMKKNATEEKLPHQVCYEVTHHGPYMKTPTMFAEVGSNEKEWNKEKPANTVAKSLLELLNKCQYEKNTSNNIPVLIGIGGGHYAPRFTDVALNKKSAFGHMIPSYHIKQGNINTKIFKKAIKATPNVKAVYFHRKALKKSQVTEYGKWFEKQKIPVISSKDLEDL
jgi:D-aminoacyl-tRNA deacylase